MTDEFTSNIISANPICSLFNELNDEENATLMSTSSTIGEVKKKDFSRLFHFIYSVYLIYVRPSKLL